jgi:hypothetical protein
MKAFDKNNNLKDINIMNSEDSMKFEIIEDALLENVTGAGAGAAGESEMCMCWQFCQIPPSHL